MIRWHDAQHRFDDLRCALGLAPTPQGLDQPVGQVEGLVDLLELSQTSDPQLPQRQAFPREPIGLREPTREDFGSYVQGFCCGGIPGHSPGLEHLHELEQVLGSDLAFVETLGELGCSELRDGALLLCVERRDLLDNRQPRQGQDQCSEASADSCTPSGIPLASMRLTVQTMRADQPPAGTGGSQRDS
jgi:hypothetical protein